MISLDETYKDHFLRFHSTTDWTSTEQNLPIPALQLSNQFQSGTKQCEYIFQGIFWGFPAKWGDLFRQDEQQI